MRPSLSLSLFHAQVLIVVSPVIKGAKKNTLPAAAAEVIYDFSAQQRQRCSEKFHSLSQRHYEWLFFSRWTQKLTLPSVEENSEISGYDTLV